MTSRRTAGGTFCRARLAHAPTWAREFGSWKCLGWPTWAWELGWPTWAWELGWPTWAWELGWPTWAWELGSSASTAAVGSPVATTDVGPSTSGAADWSVDP